MLEYRDQNKTKEIEKEAEKERILKLKGRNAYRLCLKCLPTSTKTKAYIVV